jgi:acetyl esterase
MDLVTDPRLRELISAVTPLVNASPAPAVKHHPTEPDAREEWFTSVAHLRAGQHARVLGMLPPAESLSGVEVTEVRIPVSGSCGWSGCEQCTAGSIAAVIYTPSDVSDAPAYLHLHGGGWWVNGGVDMLRATGTVHAARARELGIVVIDVDYRLAPEHKFPIPVEDGYAALGWVSANAGQLGVDASRIAVGGGSAGANLAAAVALMSRDRNGPKLRGQTLHIPVLDSSCNSPSMHRFAEGYVMTYRHATEMWDMYLSVPSDAYNPYASPSHASRLDGLPPAIVIVGDYEVLRDEGLAYARRLVDEGVEVTVCRLPQCHGAALPETTATTERLINDFLRIALR